MRKFILASVLVLASSAAFAAPTTRGLSAAEPAKVSAPEPVQAQEAAKPSVAEQLKALGEVPKEKPAQVTALPSVDVEEPTVKPKAAKVQDANAEMAPAKKRTAKTSHHRRESDMRKARRYAGYFGIRW